MLNVFILLFFYSNGLLLTKPKKNKIIKQTLGGKLKK
jgi:hypothetical protein